MPNMREANSTGARLETSEAGLPQRQLPSEWRERPSPCAIARFDPDKMRATKRRYQERHREAVNAKNRAH